MRERSTARSVFTGGTLIGALAAGALATAGLVSAPTAGATCASFFGINSGGDCTSNITSIAVAIGTNAKANSDGLFGNAFAVGTDASAYIVGGGFLAGGGFFNTATAVGTNSSAFTAGLFSLAVATGDNTGADAGVGSSPFTGTVQIGNATIALRGAGGLDSGSEADGIANLAVLIGQDQTAQARGIGNTSFTLFGTDSDAEAFGLLSNATNIFTANNSTASYSPTPPNAAFASAAFTLFGYGNTVAAGPGPFAVAGSISQTGQPITKLGPGFNINGVKVGGASAVRNARPAAATAHPTTATNAHSPGKGTGKSGRTAAR